MRVRNVVLALLGAAILVLKPAYHGPGEVAVQSYAGNAVAREQVEKPSVARPTPVRGSRLAR
jgi:hypothetical protein